jgi:hypothetical protein
MDEAIDILYKWMKTTCSSYEYIAYGFLFSLLNEIHQNSSKNQMTSGNLSIVFVPFLIQQKTKVATSKEFIKNLLRGKSILIFIIENYSEIFDKNLIDAQYKKYSSSTEFSPLNSENSSKSMGSKGFSFSNTPLSPTGSLNSILSFGKPRSHSDSAPTSPTPLSSGSIQTLNIKYDPTTEKYSSIWNQSMFLLVLDEKEVLIFMLTLIV